LYEQWQAAQKKVVEKWEKGKKRLGLEVGEEVEAEETVR